jgi:hypothetical protein
MLIEVTPTHENLEKNFFESNLKTNNNIAFPYTFNYGSKCDE